MGCGSEKAHRALAVGAVTMIAYACHARLYLMASWNSL